MGCSSKVLLTKAGQTLCPLCPSHPPTPLLPGQLFCLSPPTGLLKDRPAWAALGEIFHKAELFPGLCNSLSAQPRTQMSSCCSVSNLITFFLSHLA